MIGKYIIFLALCFQAIATIKHFLPTSTVVRIAAMAARDEGYNPDAQGVFLDELRTDGKEPIAGFTSIGLYKGGHLIRYYSIRVETGDIVDPMACKVFRYPDLAKFKREILKQFGTKEVSLEVIASEVGCEKLEVVPTQRSAGSSK